MCRGCIKGHPRSGIVIPSCFCAQDTRHCPGASTWHPNQNRHRHQPSPVPLLRPRSCSLTGHRLEASSLAFSSLLSWRRSRIPNRDDSPISKRISKGHKRRQRRMRQSASDMKSLMTIRRRPMKSKQRSTPRSRTR